MALIHSSTSFSSFHICLHSSCIALCNFFSPSLMNSAGIPSCPVAFQFFNYFIIFTVSSKFISLSFSFALCSFHSGSGISGMSLLSNSSKYSRYLNTFVCGSINILSFLSLMALSIGLNWLYCFMVTKNCPTFPYK